VNVPPLAYEPTTFMLRKISPLECHACQTGRAPVGVLNDSNVEPLPSKSSPLRVETCSVPSIR
jgi:hypothetical protein